MHSSLVSKAIIGAARVARSQQQASTKASSSLIIARRVIWLPYCASRQTVKREIVEAVYHGFLVQARACRENWFRIGKSLKAQVISLIAFLAWLEVLQQPGRDRATQTFYAAMRGLSVSRFFFLSVSIDMCWNVLRIFLCRLCSLRRADCLAA